MSFNLIFLRVEMGHFIVTVTYNKIMQCHWFDDIKHVFDCCSSSRSHCNIFIDIIANFHFLKLYLTNIKFVSNLYLIINPIFRQYKIYLKFTSKFEHAPGSIHKQKLSLDHLVP
jgi:hypothetical protein